MHGPDVITRTVWYEDGRYRTSRHASIWMEQVHERIHEEHLHNVGFYPPKELYQVIYQRSEFGACQVIDYKRAYFPDACGVVPVCFLHVWPVGTRFHRYVVTV